MDAPYEIARARVVLAEAYRVDEQPDRAAIEVRTARDAFERLGAAPDLRRAEALMKELASGLDAEPLGMATTRIVRVFMFTDIVDSTRLAETLGDQAWDGLIRWHDRTLRGAVAEQGGEEVKATGDGFFLAFTDPDPAIEAAVTIPGLQSRAAAEGDEILASATTHAGARHAFVEASRRTVELKGLAAPVEVVSIDWR